MLKRLDEVTPNEYLAWFQEQGTADTDPIRRAAARHILALQDRLNALPEELRCGCAFNHPDDICAPHHER